MFKIRDHVKIVKCYISPHLHDGLTGIVTEKFQERGLTRYSVKFDEPPAQHDTYCSGAVELDFVTELDRRIAKYF